MEDAALHGNPVASAAAPACAARWTLPTSLDLEERDPAAPGLRIDFALASPGLRAAYEPAAAGAPACRALRSFDELLPPHLLAGLASNRTQGGGGGAGQGGGLAYAQPDLLARLPLPAIATLSDHFPIICEWRKREGARTETHNALGTP